MGEQRAEEAEAAAGSPEADAAEAVDSTKNPRTSYSGMVCCFREISGEEAEARAAAAEAAAAEKAAAAEAAAAEKAAAAEAAAAAIAAAKAEEEANFKAKFNKFANGKETVTRDAAFKLLLELGKTDPEAEDLLATTTKTEITYRHFKLMWASQEAFGLHDVPVIGYLTTAGADSFCRSPSDEQIGLAFERQLLEIDSDGKTLDQTSVAEALRYLGKSERQIQKLIDYMREDVDLEGFSELVKPGAKPWFNHLGPVPVPNHEKVLDMPVVGHSLHFVGNLVQEPLDVSLRVTWRSLHSPTDGSLRHTFNKLDEDHSGKLDKRELGNALRVRGESEAYIKRALDSIKEDVTLYEFKELVRGKKFPTSTIQYLPVVGPALSDHMLAPLSELEVDEDDMLEAFNEIDKSGNGKIDKTEVVALLRELGKSERDVQIIVDNYLDKEELDFDGFKELMLEKPRPWIAELGGIPVPNVAVVHDVPILGMLTKFAQTVSYDCYDWTLGQGLRTFKSLSDEELRMKFDELDTDKKGVLNAKQVAKALRDLGHTEGQISRMIIWVEEPGMSFEDLKTLVAPWKTPVYMGGYEPGDEPWSNAAPEEEEDTEQPVETKP